MDEKKCLLVTGASSAMGEALIRKVADKYDTIWAHFARREEGLQALSASLGEKLIPVKADFSVDGDIVSMMERIREDGRMPGHIVHLAARPASFLKFGKYTWEDYQKEADISLRSAVRIMQGCLPAMAKAKDGKVIFMLTAFLTGAEPKYMSPYITTKYALYGLLRTLSAEYEGKGISFSSVSPEMTDTPFLDAVPDTVKDIAAAAAPDGKLLSPNCVAEAVKQLLEDTQPISRHLYVDAAGTIRDARIC